MVIGKGMLILIVMLSLFAGPGALHIAQMVGLLKVSVTLSPDDFVDDYSMPTKKVR